MHKLLFINNLSIQDGEKNSEMEEFAALFVSKCDVAVLSVRMFTVCK